MEEKKKEKKKEVINIKDEVSLRIDELVASDKEVAPANIEKDDNREIGYDDERDYWRK